MPVYRPWYPARRSVRYRRPLPQPISSSEEKRHRYPASARSTGGSSVGVDGLLVDARADALGENGGGGMAIGPGQEDGELLAAVAAQHVDRSQGRAAAIGQPAQHLVAHRVAVLVVDALEVVHVEH